ncbi:MAG: AraD1 family protein [Opitutus sp.]
MTRIVQLKRGSERRVALVQEPSLRLLVGFDTTLALALAAIDGGKGLIALITQAATSEQLSYDEVYRGVSPWRLVAPIDHGEPSRCLVSGTGLTHLGSAKNRQSMHSGAATAETDSMRMFRWGVEGGRPATGEIGTSPEWFFKGVGTILRGPGEPLVVSSYAEDGGEEAEIAGVYLIDRDGHPRRIGMAIGNEFSDHRFEKKNYLNLAGSKIRTCALGPELVIDPDFKSVVGRASIERAGQTIWTREIATGETEMCHSLQNIEHHHFKFETHRRPGDVHVHYYGAHSLSFGDGVELMHGDSMVVEFTGYGRPLRNPIQISDQPDPLILVRSLA